ncbi:MAG TPA: cell division protein FtsQ/DivIB [Vitreimonas sp.]|uniref:cell division protein FtsQ/DivIB n=1 Tax=Vitreimonas sp. TaxID=3069702 RepID=UPI002D3FD8A1|nr:cell division protein FtsQ/DivIB [Vitreimonas sp.]HYD86552.1 cell division protein FtsQ/DivIB [Vitreimonas sp.]
MAAVRARRSGGRAAEPARGKRRKTPAVSSYDNMPRLARIKLSGGLTPDDVQVTSKSLLVALTGAVLFVGIAVASAAWLGSSLFDAREAFARSADSAAAGVGFNIASVDVDATPGGPAITDARREEVRALIVPDGRRSILALEPNEVKARVESLDWVASARVRRLWPSTLEVAVERRQEYALWEEDGHVSVIDINGERLLAERAADHPNLPLIVGRGAGPAAEPLLQALESLPNVRSRLVQIVRVGDRRWNLELNSGAMVALPEEGAPAALARLESLHARYALLDRPVRQLDLRTPGQLAVRVHPTLAGGLNPLLGGV